MHAVVCVDGHPLAKKGRAGPAIFIAMIASFIGVSVGIVLMALLSPLLADVAFMFGPQEYFTLMLMGLLAASTLTSGAPLKGIASVFIGLLFGVVGTDVMTGVSRFDFGISALQDGVSLVVLATALFGIADVLANAGKLGDGSFITNTKIDRNSIRLEKGELKQSAKPMLRGSAIGSVLGVLPGAGGTLAAFMSYAIEKKRLKHLNVSVKEQWKGYRDPNQQIARQPLQRLFLP